MTYYKKKKLNDWDEQINSLARGKKEMTGKRQEGRGNRKGNERREEWTGVADKDFERAGRLSVKDRHPPDQPQIPKPPTLSFWCALRLSSEDGSSRLPGIVNTVRTAGRGNISRHVPIYFLQIDFSSQSRASRCRKSIREKLHYSGDLNMAS